MGKDNSGHLYALTDSLPDREIHNIIISKKKETTFSIKVMIIH